MPLTKPVIKLAMAGLVILLGGISEVTTRSLVEFSRSVDLLCLSPWPVFP